MIAARFLTDIQTAVRTHTTVITPLKAQGLHTLVAVIADPIIVFAAVDAVITAVLTPLNPLGPKAGFALGAVGLIQRTCLAQMALEANFFIIAANTAIHAMTESLQRIRVMNAHSAQIACLAPFFAK